MAKLQSSGNIQFDDQWAGKDPHAYDIDYDPHSITIRVKKGKFSETINIHTEDVPALVQALRHINRLTSK